SERSTGSMNARPVRTLARKRGSRRWGSTHDVWVEIPPFAIVALDQFELPLAAPFLDLLLPQNGIRHRLMELQVDQQVDAVFLSEAGDSPGSVLPHSASDVARHADIERAVPLTCKDVDASSTHDAYRAMSSAFWVPAFAGM